MIRSIVSIWQANACTTDWEDGCEIPGLSGGIRAAPLVDSNGDIYIGTKDNDDSKLYKIDGTCPASPVIWETDTNADVYTTGVLLDSDLVVIGTEPDEDGRHFEGLQHYRIRSDHGGLLQSLCRYDLGFAAGP